MNANACLHTFSFERFRPRAQAVDEGACSPPGRYSRVILKRHGEFIYTPPLYLCYAAEKRQPPLVSVSLRPALNPPPSLSSAPHDEATAEREHYSVSVQISRSDDRRSTPVLRRVTRANLQPFRKFNPQVSRSMLP